MTTLPIRDYPRNVKPSFCKVICGHDAYIRMRFPDPWFEFYETDLPSPVKLVMLNGVPSTVGITKTGNEAYLDEKWKDFVYTHTIEVRDTLIFTHEGGSDFKILSS
ncbi:putative B3 domain-containing protein isoform X3 [Salvia divinorum]|uniref:B3 domain-containing protein isoform X3 n=1 Tax=Salvia divinorum TaxID=28513 RepID=A0ABD1I5J1_SALDI